MPAWAIALTIWLILAGIAAILIGRAIWIADQKQKEDNDTEE